MKMRACNKERFTLPPDNAVEAIQRRDKLLAFYVCRLRDDEQSG